MGWLNLGKSDKSIDANNLFREAEKRERLLKELEKSEKEKEHDKIVATAMRLYL